MGPTAGERKEMCTIALQLMQSKEGRKKITDEGTAYVRVRLREALHPRCRGCTSTGTSDCARFETLRVVFDPSYRLASEVLEDHVGSLVEAINQDPRSELPFELAKVETFFDPCKDEIKAYVVAHIRF
jgi:hypothetical protein